jgi:hypothetical protein
MKRVSVLLAILSGCLGGLAQSSLPDRVPAGSTRLYWVDSAASPGSVYTWSVDGRIIRTGPACAFSYTWVRPGLFELTVWQESPAGCRGEPVTGRVIVDLPAKEQASIFPNPVTGPDLVIRLNLPRRERISCNLYTPGGQLVARLYEGDAPGGESQVFIYRHDLPQGIYLYQIGTDNQTINGRIIVIRQF